MSGSEYRWLALHPLIRGSLLSLAVAAFCVGSFFMNNLTPATCADPVVQVVAASAPAHNAGEPAHTPWPHTVLRLWLLVPQLLPTHDR
jgi:hypothetical protein